jgi:ribulose-phosphate 3-epimerase
MAHIVAPSLLAADFLHLADALDMINGSNADWLHLDIMDGSFVPNISFGQVLMPFIKKGCTKPLDVHLMIEDPARYVDEFIDAGASVVTVHIEADRHLHRTIQHIKSRGVKAGVALNPHTSVDLLDDILEDLDLVTIMSVNPGYGGQKFIYQTVPKVKQLKTKLIERNLDVYIEIDGGVGMQNAEALLQAGANVLVAGSSVFKVDDPLLAIDRLKSISSPFL